MSAPSVRDKLLSSAARLFYADGIAATGVGSIIEGAGVAKMSLYNNFASKDALVVAYIEARHEEWLGLYEQRASSSSNGRDGVLAVVDAYIDHAQLGYERGFRGCGLLNAAAELPVGSQGRESVRRHKEHVEQILREHLATLTDGERSARVAEHCSFILEGGMARAGLEGGPDRLLHARGIIETIVAEL